MTLLKKITKSKFARRTLSSLITFYVRLVWLTSRWDAIGREYPQEYWNKNKAMIGCFWHGRMLMMFKTWLGSHKFHMLISSHADGEIIAHTTQNFGFGWVAGSSTRGGHKALMECLRLLKKGESIGITPDGPRGPRYQVSLGVIQIARLSGVPIWPFTYSSTKGIFIKSWDQFFLPFPFGKGVFIYAPMLDVARSSKTDEELRQDLENTLRDLTAQADRYCGQVAP